MKKMISVMLVIGMMLCFAGCGDSTSDSVADIYYNDERLSNYYNNYSMSDCSELIDTNTISGSYQDFNGMVILWMYEDDGGFAVDINHLIRVTDGKVKLVLYYTDGTVVSVDTIEEFTSHNAYDTMQTATIVLDKGLSCVKLVGTENADVTFEINIKGGSFIGAQ